MLERLQKTRVFMEKYEPAYFIYNGVSSQRFGLRILNSLEFPSPTYDYEFLKIAGRDGDLLYYQDRLEDFEFVIPCKIRIQDVRDIATLARDIHKWLSPETGYKRLEISAMPHHFLKAIHIETINIEEQLRTFGTVELRFKCYPAYFAKSGEHQFQLPKSNMELINIYNRVAKPELTFVGSGSTHLTVSGTVNGRYVHQHLYLNNVEHQIILNSATLTAKGSVTQNPWDCIGSFPFPVLGQGVNYIYWTTFDNDFKVYITPNWAD